MWLVRAYKIKLLWYNGKQLKYVRNSILLKLISMKFLFDLAKFIFCEILTAAFLFVFFVIIWWIQTLYLVFSLKISIRHRKKITIIFSWLSYYVVYILNSYAISDGYVVIFVRMAWLVHIVYFWSYFMLLLICTNLCKKQSGHCIVYI